MTKTKISLITLASLFFSAQAQAGMCALCKRALEQSGNCGLIRGFYLSILLIGGIPLILMGAGVWIVRRAEKKRTTLQ